nr:hypothetical protein [Candidatus Freyarchaeota archaeon]
MTVVLVPFVDGVYWYPSVTEGLQGDAELTFDQFEEFSVDAYG